MWKPILAILLAASPVFAASPRPARESEGVCAGKARLTWALDLDRHALRRIGFRQATDSDCARERAASSDAPEPNAVIELRDRVDAMLFRKAISLPVVPHGKPLVSAVMPWDPGEERQPLRLQIVQMKDGKTLAAGKP